MTNRQDQNMTKEDQILQNTTRLCEVVDMMRKDYNKIIYALLAIICANIGLKFAGTPVIVDVAIYLSIFGGVFTALLLPNAWKHLTPKEQALRVAFTVFILTNGIVQTIIYRPGEEKAPMWWAPVVDGFLAVIAALFIWSMWTWRPGSKAKGTGDQGSQGCK